MSSEAARQFTDALNQAEILSATSTIQLRGIQTVYDQCQPNISASEALYAFFGHLCNLSEPTILSKKHNVVRLYDLLEEFCRLNNLPDPEPGWEKKLNPRFYKEIKEMNGNCIMHQQPLSLCPECKDNAVKEMRKERNITITRLRGTLINISVEDCVCKRRLEDEVEVVDHICSRCRALDVLEETKSG